MVDGNVVKTYINVGGNHVFSDLKLLALSSNNWQSVAQEIGIESWGKSTVRQFSMGRFRSFIEESIRGKHVFILQSTSSPVNDNSLKF